LARSKFDGYIFTEKALNGNRCDAEESISNLEPSYKSKLDKLGESPYNVVKEILHDGIEEEIDEVGYMSRDTLEDFIGSFSDVDVKPAQVGTMIKWMVEEGLLEGVK
jgi:hypothetical protein